MFFAGSFFEILARAEIFTNLGAGWEFKLKFLFFNLKFPALRADLEDQGADLLDRFVRMIRFIKSEEVWVF